MFYSGISATAVNRIRVLVLLLCGFPTLTLAQPLAKKPITLPGTHQGLQVQCNGMKPLVKVKGKFIDFKQYRALKVAELKKKIKKASELKAALDKLNRELNTLEQTLRIKCEDAQNLCFKPRVKVLFTDKTSKCVSATEANKLCDTSTISCTNSVPGSCSCQSKPAPIKTPTPTPTPTQTPTPTPTPPGGGGSGSPIGGTGPINGYQININPIYVNSGHKFFIGDITGGASGTAMNSFFNAISNNGIIAGGYYVRQQKNSPDGGYEMYGSSGLHRYDEPNTIIIPFLEYKGKFHEACAFNSCPAGVILGAVNDLGVAIESSSYYSKKGTSYVFNSPLNYIKAIKDETVCWTNPIDINNSNVLLAKQTCPDKSTTYMTYTPQGKFTIDITPVETAYWQIIRARGLEAAKKYARERMECTENEIQAIKISSIKAPSDLTPSGMNNLGDTYGYIDDLFLELNFTSPCWEGEENLWGSGHTGDTPKFFTIKRDGSFSFVNGDERYYIHAPLTETFHFGYPRLNDKRILTTMGVPMDSDTNPMRPIAVNAADAGSPFSMVPFTGLPYEDVFPLALNNRNEMVGFATNPLGNGGNPWKGTDTHAVASLVGGTLDLNKLFPGSDWILTRANDINDCGEIVGLAYNPKLDLFRGFLLSPTGCR